MTASRTPVRLPDRLVRRALAVSMALALACPAATTVAFDTPEVPDWHDYLPPDMDYHPEAPTPEELLGWRFGQWHLHHHELVRYFETLAAWSDRVTLVEYARSHGRRPLVLAVVTSPANHERLEDLRRGHVDQVLGAWEQESQRLQAGAEAGATGDQDDPDAGGDGADSGQETPLIVWMGYGVHGDEPSASQAAPLLAYHLAAARAEEVGGLLDDTVVLIDPCLNPDGMERFAAWTNFHRGRHPSPHRRDQEHVQAFPGGRTNYYWFDLNRDWLPAVHPESRGRLRLFHQWLPQVLTDYHEMGNVNRSYFFQPGIPDMVHPLTPELNQRLTLDIARHHAAALDELGTLYYTGETFDDFYIGKGSTYPDLNGSIGILFEQASSRGFHQDTEHGRLTFPTTIRHQVVTSLSTLRAADELRGELSSAQRQHHREAAQRAAKEPVKAHVVSAPDDRGRLTAFAELLDLHGIRHARLGEAVRADGQRFRPRSSLVIPADQPRHHLLTAMLETRTEFESNVFYDVSAWHLPSAFGLLHAELPTVPAMADEPVATPQGRVIGPREAVAYLVPWPPQGAPGALARLGRENVRSWVAQRPIVTAEVDGGESWPHGTIVVPVAVQEEIGTGALRRLMRELAAEHGLRIRAVSTGLGDGGIDLGSPSLAPVAAPEVLLVVGPGASSQAAGAVWHQFDQVWQAPLTMVEGSRINPALLRDFNTLILADAPFRGLPSAARSAIESWVRQGGCLIAFGTSVSSLAEQEWVGVETRKAAFDGPDDDEEPPPTSGEGAADDDGGDDGQNHAEDRAGAAAEIEVVPHPADTPYDGAAERRALRNVRGVVVGAWLDATHPLAYGYSDHGPQLALLRQGTTFLERSDNSLRNPLVYTDDPLIAGAIAAPNLQALRGSTPVQVRPVDSGRVILMTDNPVFRGHWHGSARLLANAVFFGRLVSAGSGGGDGEEDHDGPAELDD